MEIMLGLAAAAGRPSSVEAPAAGSLLAIAADGWQATATDPGLAAGKTITVQRAGHDALGASIMVTERLAITARVRMPYPDQFSLTADKVALSGFVHAGDTISGVANNSTRAAPQPVAMWLNRDKDICKTATYTARLAVAHARSGRPVAAVRFRATDGTATIEALVSAMSATTYAASGLTVPHFAGALDFSGFANGATITVDAVIYPWVGAAFTISTDADAYPSPNLTTLRVLNDRTGAWGTAYAYVDATLGTASGTVSTDPATAAAAPFQTVVQAATAVRAFNNANFGRNFTDGGIIRLVAGTHTMASALRTVGPTNIWPLTIEAADAAARAGTIFTDRGSSLIGSLPNQIVIRNLTLRRSGTGSYVFLDNGAGSLSYTNLMSIENCLFDANGAGAYKGWIYTTGCGYFINCDQVSDCGQANVTGTVNKAIRSIGCQGSFVSNMTVFGALGCVGDGTATAPAATAGRVAAKGTFFGWCLLTSAGTNRPLDLLNETGPRGFAAVGCVFEQSATTTPPAAYVSADNAASPQQNVVLMCCTVAGSRTNWLYQDSGTTSIDKSGYMKFVVHENRNTKSDVFGTNAALTGNWPVIYNVGHLANCARRGGNDGSSTSGVGNWLGEVAAAGDLYGTVGSPVVVLWASDRSAYGAGGGYGDYTPGAGTALPFIPAGCAPYPVDMKGRTIADDGTARIGALQPA